MLGSKTWLAKCEFFSELYNIYHKVSENQKKLVFQSDYAQSRNALNYKSSLKNPKQVGS